MLAYKHAVVDGWDNARSSKEKAQHQRGRLGGKITVLKGRLKFVEMSEEGESWLSTSLSWSRTKSTAPNPKLGIGSKPWRMTEVMLEFTVGLRIISQEIRQQSGALRGVWKPSVVRPGRVRQDGPKAAMLFFSGQAGLWSDGCRSRMSLHWKSYAALWSRRGVRSASG